MDSSDFIVLAMASAAAASFRPNPFSQRRPEETAYLALKRQLAERYPAVPYDILDIGPASAERQAALKAKLQETGADRDEAILQAAAGLARLVLKHKPTSVAAVFADPADLEKIPSFS
jgi:hypothetical protein